MMAVVTTFLTCYAIVLVIAWFRAMAREDHRTHVAHFVMLCGVLVPVVSVFVLMVFAGGVLGIPQVVPLLSVVLPGGVVIAMQLEVSRLAPVSVKVELLRLGLAAAITGLSLAPQFMT